ncbi:MAG: hypothetical protein ACTHQQ_06500, partial [Solirubrobacteraceae bacterium]
MVVRMRLTDYQLAVAERAKDGMGATTFDELAAQAVDHERRRQPETLWRPERPRPRAAAPRPDHVQLDRVLPAASAVALTVRSGQRLRLQQLKDGQGADLHVQERAGRAFSAARTRAEHG